MSPQILYDALEHEALTEIVFDPDAARAFIVDVVRTVDGMYDRAAGWLLHPEDDYGQTNKASTLGVYFGAAGTIWGLSHLAKRYDLVLRHDYAHAIERVEERYEACPDEERGLSYLVGICGIAFVRYILTRESAALDRCMRAAARNVGNPTREFLWGSPGSVFPALILREVTGEDRFDDLIRAVQDELWKTWEPEREDGGLLWRQDMYGRHNKYLGAAHGAITNIAVLLRAIDLLDSQRRNEVLSRTRAFLERYASVDGDAVNWYAMGDPVSENRLQWCHGAAGIITSLAALKPQDDVVEDLLRRGGNAIWQAGPLKKGPTLCHGTAGNGFAFLQLALRSGEAIWLERAQHFAMHAIHQVQAWRAQFGRPSASFWTGEIGVALYVDAVLRNDPRMLSIDVA